MAEIVRFRGEDVSVMLVELTQPALAAPESDVGLVVKEGEGGVREAATRLGDSLGSVEGAAVALLPVLGIGAGTKIFGLVHTGEAFAAIVAAVSLAALVSLARSGRQTTSDR